MKAIAYRRVSSKRQGESKLGLLGQLESIQNFCGAESLELVADFVDVESGGKDERTGLNEALKLAKEIGATIVVAKLDRLSRDVHYISGLMKHNVPFIVAELGKDVPSFMLHIYASFAELERSMIRKRVKESLAQAKKRGTKLGTHIPQVKEACRAGNIKRGNKSFEAILPHIQEAQEQGFTSTRKIATFLNDKGITTPRGKSWTSKQISRILIKMKGQLAIDFSQGQ